MTNLLIALEGNPWPGVAMGIASLAATCVILWLMLRD